jgi:hypothetical protein
MMKNTIIYDTGEGQEGQWSVELITGIFNNGL